MLYILDYSLKSAVESLHYWDTSALSHMLEVKTNVLFYSTLKNLYFGDHYNHSPIHFDVFLFLPALSLH